MCHVYCQLSQPQLDHMPEDLMMRKISNLLTTGVLLSAVTGGTVFKLDYIVLSTLWLQHKLSDQKYLFLCTGCVLNLNATAYNYIETMF